MGIPPEHPAIRQAIEKGLIPAPKAKPAEPLVVLDRMEATLPFPPSVNRYWRRVGNKTLLSAPAREYRKQVVKAFASYLGAVMTGPVSVTIVFHPPDRRRRDLDNLPKGLLDALKYARVYEDDSQVRHLNLWFGDVVDGGKAVVTVTATEGV